MKIRERLLQRVSLDDIQQIIHLMDHEHAKELFNLLFDADDQVAYRSAWILSHLSLKDNEWLSHGNL